MSYIVAYLDQWLGRKTASVVSRKKNKIEEPVASGTE
jgi:hypothetical protein